jgi:PilZ domain
MALIKECFDDCNKSAGEQCRQIYGKNWKAGMNMERRKSPRIGGPLTVTIRGSHGDDKTRQFDAVAQDIGAGGVRCLAPQVMKTGEKVFLHMRFSLADSNRSQAPTVSAYGVVMRVDVLPDGGCIFAACFLRRHFI